MANKKKQIKRKKARANVKQKRSINTPNSGKELAIWLAVVIGLTLLTYSTAFHTEFTNWDDTIYVSENTDITQFNAETIGRMFSDYMVFNYHPLTMVSLALQYQFFELNASGYHAINILLHLLNTLLVFLFILKLSNNNKLVAFITALLFGIHPMHVESVTWVAAHKDVLYTLFFLWSAIAYLQFKERKQSKYLYWSIAAFLLSCLSKPSAVVLPLVLLLIDFVQGQSLFNTKLWLQKTPYFAIAIVFGLLTINAQTSDGAVVGDMGNYSIADKILFAFYGIQIYLFKIIAPINLSAFYQYPPAGKLPLAYLIAPITVLAVTGLAVWSLKKTRLIAFGLLFFLVNVALVLQLVSVGKAIVADRYTYVAYIGLFYVMAVGLHYLYKHQNNTYKNVAIGGFALFAIACMVLSFNRNKVWANSKNLWTDVITKDPTTALAYNSRGNYYYEQKKYDKALKDYEKAIQYDAQNYLAYTNRANIFETQGQYNKAIEDYTKSLSIKKNHYKGLINRAKAYMAIKDYPKSIADYKQATLINPKGYDGYFGLGRAYRLSGDVEQALKNYNKAIQIRPNYYLAYTNRGNVYFDQQQYQQAIADYQKAIQLNPKDAKPYGNIGAVYYQQANYNKAVEFFTNAIKNSPKNGGAGYYQNRSFAYNQLGQKQNALKDAQKAKSLGANIDDAYMQGLR